MDDSSDGWENSDDGISVLPVTDVISSPDTVGNKFQYKVYSPQDLLAKIDEIINEVGQIVGLKRSVVRILLQHYKWDKQKLLERYFEEADHKRLLREAHGMSLLDDSGIDRESDVNDSSDNSDTDRLELNDNEVCGICLHECLLKDMTRTQCFHRFCNSCWNSYLKSQIIDQCRSDRISCPASACSVQVGERIIRKLIKDKDVLARYQKLICNSFVESNKLFRWCPNPGCMNAIGVHYIAPMAVKCNCGALSCFQCGHRWHEPINCKLLAQWLIKCEDDSESANWLAANTKDCPGCHFPIEKRGGCNHMTCTNPSCGHEFCWVCLGPWKPHGSDWYQCNRYNEDSSVKIKSAMEASRQALLRYLHFYNRYINHKNSLKLEHKLQRDVLSKMDTLQSTGMSWIEIQFLPSAVEVLLQCRQTLMYTYAFAFYLKKSNQSEVFEQNQADLERATEGLSFHLERDLKTENISQYKRIIQDKYRYCDQRRKVLLEHVQEGYDREYWEYRSEIMTSSRRSDN